jgi:hypothetical protein
VVYLATFSVPILCDADSVLINMNMEVWWNDRANTEYDEGNVS